jgi:hypothetical protein
MQMTRLEYFEEKYMPEPMSGCWLWFASDDGNGYGAFWNGKAMIKAYRWAYEYFIGKVPIGLELDHLCENKMCVNPKHLEPVTHLENVRRGKCSETSGQWQRDKTHCPQGHSYSGDNLYIRPNGTGRGCRICRKERYNSNR